MNFEEMNQAVKEAARTLRIADNLADSMARLLVGRLRHVDGRTLKLLKAELRDFNGRGYSGGGWYS